MTFAYSFNVTVQDSAGNLAPEAALAISVAPAVTISMITLPGGTVGAAYSQTLTATGGASSTYTWAISSGSLPPGLTLNPSDMGVIGGNAHHGDGQSVQLRRYGQGDTAGAGRVSAAENLFNRALRPSATPTTITLTSSINPATYGQAVTLTATVSPGPSTGKVTFYDGVSVLDTIPVSGGTAVLTTILLGPGGHSLRASFNGPAFLYVIEHFGGVGGGRR